MYLQFPIRVPDETSSGTWKQAHLRLLLWMPVEVRWAFSNELVCGTKLNETQYSYSHAAWNLSWIKTRLNYGKI